MCLPPDIGGCKDNRWGDSKSVISSFNKVRANLPDNHLVWDHGSDDVLRQFHLKSTLYGVLETLHRDIIFNSEGPLDVIMPNSVFFRRRMA